MPKPATFSSIQMPPAVPAAVSGNQLLRSCLPDRQATIKARYGFSIGGRPQSHAAILVGLLAGLGLRHSPPPSSQPGYAYVPAVPQPNQIS